MTQNFKSHFNCDWKLEFQIHENLQANHDIRFTISDKDNNL